MHGLKNKAQVCQDLKKKEARSSLGLEIQACTLSAIKKQACMLGFF